MPALLQVEDLKVHFPAGGLALPGAPKRLVKAVNGVSFDLARGETLGLVGESGCGKSTLGRAILHLNPITTGKVIFDGTDMSLGRTADVQRLRSAAAMIFQDPYNSLSPRQSIGDTLAEVLRVQRKIPGGKIAERVRELLTLVGLNTDLINRKPATLSGGQCQRVGIARALAIDPQLVIADECVAALDVSIQAQIINLLIELKQRMNLSLIFIAHDLGVVRRLCDRVAVMYLGRIVETGPVEQIFRAPKHPYTAALIRAIPAIDPDQSLPQQPLGGEPPSPLHLPQGCAFHPRCPAVMEQCRHDPFPAGRQVDGRDVACHLYPTAQPSFNGQGNI
jgi:peptide/nickel transport system ATP-binding protein